MSTLKQRHCIIIPAALQVVANAFAVQIGIDPEGLLNTFLVGCVPVSGEDDAVATHYLASGRVTEAQRLILEENQGAFPGAKWWRWVDAGARNGEIMAASTNELDQVGETATVTRCLEWVGLKIRRGTMEL